MLCRDASHLLLGKYLMSLHCPQWAAQGLSWPFELGGWTIDLYPVTRRDYIRIALVTVSRTLGTSLFSSLAVFDWSSYQDIILSLSLKSLLL